MVPAPVECSQLPGHRQRSQIPQHRQWWRSPSLAQRCGAAARKDQRNLAASTACAAVTRAREAGADSSALGGRPTCTGRLGGAAAAGRRRQFFLAELVLADSAADAGARATGADADVGFAWSGRRRWCRRRSSAASYRVIGNDRKFRSTDSGGALPRSLSAAEPRLGKISGIWQLVGAAAMVPAPQRATGSSATIANSAALTVEPLCAAVTRAREAGADSSALGGRPTCTGRLGGAAAAGRRRQFFLAELVLANSAADAGARATGADADVGFAWSGRRRWCRRRSSAASYRVIGNDRKFRSTDSGGALPRSLSAAEPRLGKISGIWQRQPLALPSRARRE